MSDENTLAHYGTPRHSGRYPWGSGEDPYQSGLHFQAAYEELKKAGLSQKEIASGLGFDSTSDLRTRMSISTNDIRAERQRQVNALAQKSMSNVAIGKQLGMNESTVRSLQEPLQIARANRHRVIAGILRNNVDQYKFVDVGKGVANRMEITENELKTAISVLRDEEGYRIAYQKIKQVGTGKDTSLKILVDGTTTDKEVYHEAVHGNKLHSINEFVDPTTDKESQSIGPLVNFSSKRLGIIYVQDGGANADGVMYLRPGVPDISLGNAQYAQVRVPVDGTHYIKGMAMYKDGLPEGIDILFNTNKDNTGNKLDALKPQQEGDNVFGSETREKGYTDPKTGKTKRSVLNIVNEEGDWYVWSKNFSSQFLSKQTPQLAKQQLQLTQRSKEADLNDILSLTNPEVKRKLLETFADEADASAVDLKAVGLPRTANHVILPINSLKDNEIYAPNYKNGEVVVLVRHPHGGKFEIPELTVNNSNKEAIRAIKGGKDAVGVNASVAARLSGADFDGDTVLVIPNATGKVKTSAALQGLKDFNPKVEYALPKDSLKGLAGAKNPGALKQTLMGDVSNLITDMTIKGAQGDELARAVRHSMVVIDAEKHNLDYKASAIDNNIKQLKQKYQGGATKGASTLISRTTSDTKILDRRDARVTEGGKINAISGERQYVDTGKSFTNKNGEVIFNKIKVEKGSLTKDAHTLVSDADTVIENVYADHANALKALANKARLETLKIENIKLNDSAKKAYSAEVISLNNKLNISLKNAPLERQAQLLANSIVKAKLEANPGADVAQKKKINGLALTAARSRVGAGKVKINITPDEWAAIQSGAISSSKLKAIINNTDVETVRQLATPRNQPIMNSANIALAKGMLESGYTTAQVAERLGVSTSTIYAALSPKEGE